MMGCVMAPLPFDPYVFSMVTLGTTLTSTSANTINQVIKDLKKKKITKKNL